ncbi:MAG: hypothetical protein H7Z39_17555, partial [Burkholderiaceae bacterium]|nr:hypothetical protein [Burkholderiaceae bacterium]
MNGKRQFPLPLSSVVDKTQKTAVTGPAQRVATPQTATRNAANNMANNVANKLANHARGPEPGAVAAPSRAHTNAIERGMAQAAYF